MGLESATKLSELVTTNPVVGDPVSEGDDHIRLLKTVLVNLTTFPMCLVTNTTSQSIASGEGSPTAITWDTEVFDVGTSHSTVSNTSRFTATQAGLYVLIACVSLGASGAGTFRQAKIRKNGSDTKWVVRPFFDASKASLWLIAAVEVLALNDYLEVFLEHDAGISLDTNTSALEAFFLKLKDT